MYLLCEFCLCAFDCGLGPITCLLSYLLAVGVSVRWFLTSNLDLVITCLCLSIVGVFAGGGLLPAGFCFRCCCA